MLSELPESVIQEVVAYTWNQYLADIGGATSLILGISAVTILTFIENCLKRYTSEITHLSKLQLRMYKIIAGLAIFSTAGDLRDKSEVIKKLIETSLKNRISLITLNF